MVLSSGFWIFLFLFCKLLICSGSQNQTLLSAHPPKRSGSLKQTFNTYVAFGFPNLLVNFGIVIFPTFGQHQGETPRRAFHAEVSTSPVTKLNLSMWQEVGPIYKLTSNITCKYTVSACIKKANIMFESILFGFHVSILYVSGACEQCSKHVDASVRHPA